MPRAVLALLLAVDDSTGIPKEPRFYIILELGSSRHRLPFQHRHSCQGNCYRAWLLSLRWQVWSLMNALPTAALLQAHTRPALWWCSCSTPEAAAMLKH